MEDQVNLDIRDDGVGFDPQPLRCDGARPGGRQRVRPAGHAAADEGVAGTLEVESAPGRGTAISASVPTDGGW
jgi:signal transduction histidine kinase